MTEVNVSIIIPVYNALPYLKEAMLSAIQQDLNEIEIIIIDDASTDGSDKVCDSFSKKDSRIKFFKFIKNRGVGFVRNYGLEKARGKYISFLDADDRLERDALSILYKKALKSKSELIIFGYEYFSEKKRNKKGESLPFVSNKSRKESFKNYLLNLNGFGPFAWLYFYKKSFLVYHNIKFPEGIKFEDIPFTSKAVFYAKRLEVYNGKILYHYRVHEKSIIQSVSKQKIKDRFESYGELQEFLIDQNIMDKYKNIFTIRILVFCIYKSYEDYIRLPSSESDEELDSYMDELRNDKNLLCKENLDALFQISKNDIVEDSPYRKAYFALKEWKEMSKS